MTILLTCIDHGCSSCRSQRERASEKETCIMLRNRESTAAPRVSSLVFTMVFAPKDNGGGGSSSQQQQPSRMASMTTTVLMIVWRPSCAAAIVRCVVLANASKFPSVCRFGGCYSISANWHKNFGIVFPCGAHCRAWQFVANNPANAREPTLPKFGPSDSRALGASAFC